MSAPRPSLGGRPLRLGLFIPALRRDYDRVQSALWIRALQMLEPLRAAGCEVHLNNPLRRYDVAVYHRGMRRGAVRTVRLLRRIAGRVVWDTCVDYFDRHEAADAEQVACAREIAGLAHGLCVTTEGIAESARRFNANVFVMPDPVDMEHFAGRAEPNLDAPLFGWSGVAHKASFLAPYGEFLDGRLLVVSEAPPALPFRYTFARWRHATFPAELLRCDAAFLPRTLESTYTRNNSSFKALAFAVLGIPVIANRLPSYELMARDFAAISFLEDHGDDPAAALAALRGLSADPTAVRAAYDVHLWARRLRGWLEAL